MNPFSKTWKKWKEDYKTIHFDSYWMTGRRESTWICVERFKTLNFWARFIPEYILYKIFFWYSHSNIGLFIYNILSIIKNSTTKILKKE